MNHKTSFVMLKKALIVVFSIIVMLTFVMPESVDSVQASSNSSKYKWSPNKAPNYVLRIGKAKVGHKPKAGTVKYSKLDKYGRTRTVTANVTYKMIEKSAGWREPIPEKEAPAGWGHNRKAKIKLYNGRIYRGYLYNRSHLLADSLGGHAIRKNLITGTRTQNVGANDGKGGMAFTERKVVNYLSSHKSITAYYRATPIYFGKELLPRAVVVDVKTSNSAINMRAVVYNYARGYSINYLTGSSKGNGAIGKQPQRKRASKKPKRKIHRKKPNYKKGKMVYITRTGKKYHSCRNCRGLSRARSVSRVSINNAKMQGLRPCNLCW